MIYIIKTKIGTLVKEDRFYTRMGAVAHYRLCVRELAFPDTITVEELNDGES